MKEKVLYWESGRVYIKVNSNGEIDTNLWGPNYIPAIKGNIGFALFLNYLEPFIIYVVKVDFSNKKIDVIEIGESYQNLKKIFELFKGERK